MFEEILVQLTNGGILGGLLGTIASIFTKRQERLLLRDKQAHELKLMEFSIQERKLEIEASAAEAQANLELAEVEAERAVDVANAAAFTQSIKAAAVSSGIRWVDAVRSLMRPAITTTLLAAFIMLFFKAWSFTGGVQAETMNEILTNGVNQLTFLTVTCVTWWFGSRASGFAKR
jgi:hypothetical protein